jgi:hypothetical protein
MATVKTSRAADVSPGGSRALLARHGIDIFPTLDADIVNGNVDFCTGDVRFVRPARTRRYTKDDDGVTEPLELIHGGLDKTEARLAKLDGKTATPSNRDFDGIWSRLKESDGRATARRWPTLDARWFGQHSAAEWFGGYIAGLAAKG